MKGTELIKLKDPQRFCEWMTSSQERISFLMDIISTMRRQFSDLEMVFSSDPTDEDVIVVELLGIKPYRFCLSDCCSLKETLLSYKVSQIYRDFIQSYNEWLKQYQDWWNSYHSYMAIFERFVSNE
jgi:hypothetical protein